MNDLLGKVIIVFLMLKIYFVENESQNSLVFQPVLKYFQTFTGTDEIFKWKSKCLSKESFKTRVTSGSSSGPKLTFIYKGRIGAKF